jgi:inorganic triphosphatase YgiF
MPPNDRSPVTAADAEPIREQPAPEVVLEVERKYRVHGLFRMPTLEPFAVEAPVTHRLSATYLDTEDLRLARWGVTLRRREGGSDAGWHLKLPVPDADGSREEIRLPLGEGSQVPEQLVGLVTAYVRSAPLNPVATLRTDRSSIVVRDETGAAVAEVTDDSVSVLDGDHVAARFRELEVEDLGGGTEVLDGLEQRLTDAGAIRGAFVSKAARALGPMASAEPDVAPPHPTRPQDPAGDVVRAHIARNVRALMQQDVRVRRDLPDAVHQMRVAARRIRSGLKVFTPLVDPEWSGHLRSELQWLAATLGEIRDREVLEVRLLRDLDQLSRPESVDIGPAAALVRKTLDADMATGRADVDAALSSARYVALLDALVAAAAQPQLTEAAALPAAEVLPPLVTKAWKRLARDVRRLELDAPDHDWHETRIAAKKMRYATEALVSVFGKPAKRLAEQVEQVTELLGEHQDAAQVHALATGRRVPAAAAFTLGLLYAEQRKAVDTTRLRFVAVWPEVSRRRWRRWLSES